MQQKLTINLSFSSALKLAMDIMVSSPFILNSLSASKVPSKTSWWEIWGKVSIQNQIIRIFLMAPTALMKKKLWPRHLHIMAFCFYKDFHFKNMWIKEKCYNLRGCWNRKKRMIQKVVLIKISIEKESLNLAISFKTTEVVDIHSGSF